MSKDRQLRPISRLLSRPQVTLPLCFRYQPIQVWISMLIKLLVRLVIMISMWHTLRLSNLGNWSRCTGNLRTRNMPKGLRHRDLNTFCWTRLISKMLEKIWFKQYRRRSPTGRSWSSTSDLSRWFAFMIIQINCLTSSPKLWHNYKILAVGKAFTLACRGSLLWQQGSNLSWTKIDCLFITLSRKVSRFWEPWFPRWCSTRTTLTPSTCFILFARSFM